MASISIDYSPLTCNLISLTDSAKDLLERIYPALQDYLKKEHTGTKNGLAQTRICDIILSNGTDADYLIAIGDGTKESLVALDTLIENSSRQTFLFALLFDAESVVTRCTTFFAEKSRVEEMLYDLSSLIAVRHYCNTSFDTISSFFGDIRRIKGYNYAKNLSPLDFNDCKKCWITIVRADENLTADTTLLDDVLLLLPDDCRIIWNMRASRKGEKGVSVRLYC